MTGYFVVIKRYRHYRGGPGMNPRAYDKINRNIEPTIFDSEEKARAARHVLNAKGSSVGYDVYPYRHPSDWIEGVHDQPLDIKRNE